MTGSSLDYLPNGWAAARLGDITSESRTTLNPQRHPTEVFDYFSIPAYQDGRRPVPEAGSQIRSLKLVVWPGTVLFGKLNPRVPKVWLVQDGGHRRRVASTEFIALAPAEGVDPEFLYYLAWSEFVLPKSRELVGGSTPSRQRVDVSAFQELEVPVPPLEEQRAIADVLRTVQRAKEATEQVIAAALELKQSLMRDSFASADREVRPLGEVARIERGKFSHRPRNDPAFYGGDVPFVQTGDVAEAGGRLTTYRQTLNEAGLAVSRVFPAGTIVITIAANIGHVGILEFDSAFPDSLIGITPTDHLSNEFLNYYLMTQQSEMDRLAQRGTQKNINIQFLRPWPVPVPPRDEQEEIVSSLRAVDRKIAAEEARRDALADFFDSLLHDLMGGHLRVANLIPEVT
jgi:type I restriction enzyme S subunit